MKKYTDEELVNKEVKISFKKLSKIAYLSFVNALRLHLDSILLFKNKSYSSAFQLSIIALEELGKHSMLSAWVFYNNTSEFTNLIHPDLLDSIYRHPKKQSAMIRELFSDINAKYYNQLKCGYFEKRKQIATYVGLNRIKGKIDINGHIITPNQIKWFEVKRNISLINDYLKDMCYGVVMGYISFDEDEINLILNKRLLKKLNKNWKYKSGIYRSKKTPAEEKSKSYDLGFTKK